MFCQYIGLACYTRKMKMRPIIVGTLVLCLMVAMAPWLTGGTEPLALLLSAGALLLASLLAWRQPAVRRLYGGPLVWAYLGLMGWGAVSLLWTANRYSTVIWLVGMAVAALVFRLSFTVSGETNGHRWLIRGYVAVAAAFSLHGLWLYLAGDYERLTGAFYWPNPAAAYLIPGLLLCVYGLSNTGRARWGWAALLSLLGTAFTLTGSRGAGLVLVMVGAIYLLAQRGTKRFWITFLFSILSVIVLTMGLLQLRQIQSPKAVPAPISTPLVQSVPAGGQSATDRLSYLKNSMLLFLQHPLSGVGAGAFGDVNPGVQDRPSGYSVSAHNIYVQTLAELGLIGGLLLLWVLLTIAWGTLRGLVRSGGVTVPLALGLLALLLHAGLDIDARYPAFLALAALLAGLVYAQARQEYQAGSWRLPALATLLLVPVVSLYLSQAWAERGQASWAEGDYVLAAEQYGQASQGVISNPDLMAAQAQSLYLGAQALSGEDRRLQLRRAFGLARQAQTADPHDGRHQQLAGHILGGLGDAAGAERAFRRALQLDPYNHPEYAWDLASLQLRAGRLDEAKATAEAMLNTYPYEVMLLRSEDPGVRPAIANLWALIGNVHLQRREVAEAAILADRALSIDSDNLRGRALKHQTQLRSSTK